MSAGTGSAASELLFQLGKAMGIPDQTRGASNEIAACHDEFITSTHVWLANEALRRAGLRPGTRFLEVEARSGALSILAARLGANVLATSRSPATVRRLEARANEERLSTLQSRVMDDSTFDLEKDTFDISGTQGDVMLVTGLPRALDEMVRVTKSGGRVLVVVTGSPMKTEFFSFLLSALHVVVPGFGTPPIDPVPLPFRLSYAHTLQRELSNAGLKAVGVETVAESLEFESATHRWDWVVNSHPMGAKLLAGLTEEERTAVREVLDGMLRERSGGRPAALSNSVHIGVGEK